MERNSYIRRRSFWTFFTASVLTSLVSQINSLTDGIIISHLITPDALGAIGMASPILSILFIFTVIIGAGSSIVVSKMIGSQNYSDASRMFVICTASIAVFYAIIGIALSTCSDFIAHLITDDERLSPLLAQYLPVTMLGLPVISVDMTLASFVKLAGKPRLATMATVVFCIGNILLDLLFVGVLNMGITGAAWASIVSSVLSILCFIPYLKSNECLYRRVIPDIAVFKTMFPQAVKSGLPSGIGTFSLSLMIMGLNAIILKISGADGIFILTVGLQMLTICSLIMNGAGGAIMTIGGVLLGEKDLDGYRSMVTNILTMSFPAILVISLILIIFPDVLAITFGASGDLLDRVREPLREFSLIFVPFCMITLLNCSFVVLGHRVLSSIISIVMTVFLLGIVLLSSTLFSGSLLWLSMSLGMWIVMGLVILSTWIISRRKRDVNWLTLISKYPNDPSVSRTVHYSAKAVNEMLAEMNRFISICELSEETTNHIDHCLEELSLNIINMALLQRRKGFFDIRVVYSQNEILIVLKDNNRPYNPIYSYKPETGLTADEEKLGLVLVNAMCQDINYTYMNGINCTYLKFQY